MSPKPMEYKRKKFGIEMRTDLHARLYALAVSRGMKLYQATQEAVEAYLGITALEPANEIPRKLQPYMDKLAKILASGDTQAIDAVTANVDLFLDRLRPADRKRS